MQAVKDYKGNIIKKGDEICWVQLDGWHPGEYGKVFSSEGDLLVQSTAYDDPIVSPISELYDNPFRDPEFYETHALVIKGVSDNQFD